MLWTRGHEPPETTLNQSILLPLHRQASAELSRTDPPLVLTYGEVPDEYRAAQEACAVFDRTDRGQVEVAGEDGAAFLHRILANDVRGLEPGRGNRNLLLSSKGKVRFDFDVSVEPGRFLLSTPPGQAADLMAAIDMYLFNEAVTLADRTADHAPLAMCGPEAARVVSSVCAVDAPAGDHVTTTGACAGASVTVTAQPVWGSSGFLLDAGAKGAVALWNALVACGATQAGLICADCLRVEAGWAEPGLDVDDSIYPQEARLESAFNLDKGCYIGQEVVAKIDTYKGLNKRLVALSISHDDPVPRGTRLMREDKGEWRDLGVVTSWAYSFVLDTGLVLAYVKRRHQAVGTSFRLGESEAQATVVSLPVRTGALPVSGEFE
jgi:aminomethyltransferase